jgi:hypothetical protein
VAVAIGDIELERPTFSPKFIREACLQYQLHRLGQVQTLAADGEAPL